MIAAADSTVGDMGVFALLQNYLLDAFLVRLLRARYRAHSFVSLWFVQTYPITLWRGLPAQLIGVNGSLYVKRERRLPKPFDTELIRVPVLENQKDNFADTNKF